MPMYKTEAPSHRDGAGVQERIEGVENWATAVTDELSWLLRNLGSENMNAAGLEINVSSADGKDSVGKIGFISGGVGIMSGAYGFRATKEGLQKTEDGGTTWEVM